MTIYQRLVRWWRRLAAGWRRQEGQALVLAAAASVVVMGFTAMVVDVGLILYERRHLQNVADAAALAGVLELPDSPAMAIAKAEEWASKNGFDPSDPDNTFEANTPYLGDDGKLEVRVSRPVGFLFGRVLGLDFAQVSARAVAERIPGSEGGGTPLPVPLPTDMSCSGTPVVDGRVTDGEGYTKIADLVGESADYGDAFFACDSDYYYLALRLNGPSTGGAVANENVYAPKKNSTYHSDYQTGWNKHDFKALLKSDRARFQLACDDVVVHDFIQDYLRKEGSSWASDPSGDGEIIVAGPAASASSLEWNLEHPDETGWGDDPGEEPFVPGNDKLGQSPPFNPLYPDYDAEYAGWVWEMIYEFKVPKSAYSGCTGDVLFGLHNFAGQAGPLEGIHSSPAKVEDGASLTLQQEIVRLVE